MSASYRSAGASLRQIHTPVTSDTVLLPCRILQHVLLEDQKIPYARVQNRAGNYVMPGQANSADIGSDITFPTSVLSPDWVTVIIGFSSKPCWLTHL